MCVAGGIHGGGVVGHAWQGHAWQGHAWQQVHGMGEGACMAAGVHGRGHVRQGVCMVGGVHDKGACTAAETVTAADGTHPIGMHSCHVKLFVGYLL